MKTKSPVFCFFSVVFILALFTECVAARTGTGAQNARVTVNTLAGNGNSGFAEGIGNAARFDEPFDIAIDRAGNLFVADSDNHRIRKVTPQGEVSTLAGGTEGFADGSGSAAQFNAPTGIAIDRAGNLFVADLGNHRIRKITPNGVVSTLAGGTDGFADGSGSAAQFKAPLSIAIDRAGNLYVTDTLNHRIRKVTPKGVVSTLAGGAGEGFADGIGSTAQFYYPGGISIDTAGNLYVGDRVNHRIRKITPKGVVSTLAGGTEGFADGSGGAAQFNIPTGIAIDAAGSLYVTDTGNHRIRKVTPNGVVSTLAGSASGHADGTGCAVQFDKPLGIAIDTVGNLYVADLGNHSIRKIVFEQESKGRDKAATVSSTLAGDSKGYADGIGGAARFEKPFGIAMDRAGNLFVADLGNHRIRKVTPKGEVSTLAGSGISGDADGLGSAAQFNAPVGIAIDAAGNLYVTESGNNRIRKVTQKGEVSTLAGGTRGVANGIGSTAQFYQPFGIVVDAAGNLYVADLGSARIRKVTPNGEVSTFAGSGVPGDADNTGITAQFNIPSGVAIDAAGNLYVADLDNHRIRKITPQGEVSTLAGGTRGFADGVGRAARFSRPYGIAIGATGNLYVTDTGRIRKITPQGEVSTLAGNVQGADACIEPDERNADFGIAIDAEGNLFVADVNNHRIHKIVIK